MIICWEPPAKIKLRMPNEDMDPLQQPYKNKHFERDQCQPNDVQKLSDFTFFRPPPQCPLFSINHALDQSQSLLVDLTKPSKATPSVSRKQKRLRWSRHSVLTFGTQVRGFTPGQSHRIFRAKKSSARLPSKGK